jgi:cobalt-zinc-cadmium efflux system outer membrane protein
LLVSALQARLALYNARNQYQSAWKMLGASLGRPGMAATELAGRIDVPVPVYDHGQVLAYALANHTDVRTARNSLQQTKYQLRLAQLTPIPDPDVRIGVQKDYTSGMAGSIVGTVGIGLTIPIWDRNQGGIIQAQGNVVAASEQEHLTRVNLTTTLATAYNTYLNNRIAVDMYRRDILPRQVQGYRALYERFQGEGLRVPPAAGTSAPAFADVINAQQVLITNVQAYVTALGALWQSVTDVADLLQTDDLYQIGSEQVPAEGVAPVPDLRCLKPLPCCHPCAAPEAAVPSDNGYWPSPLPGQGDKPMSPPAPETKAQPEMKQGAGSTTKPAPDGAPKVMPAAAVMPAPPANGSQQPGARPPAFTEPTPLPPPFRPSFASDRKE